MQGNDMGLEWKDQLSVGNDVIDADHKMLIDIINDTKRHLRDEHQHQVIGSLQRLYQYLKGHCATEEAIANALHYPHLSRLHMCHEELLKTLEGVMRELSDEPTPASLEKFDGFIRNWLINDVIQENTAMKPLLAKHSPRFDPR